MNRLILLLCICGLLFGCSSTQIIQVWQNEAAQHDLDSVAVVGISDSESSRRIFEDRLSALMNQADLRAIPSYTLLAENTDPSLKNLRPLAEKQGIDAILATRVIAVE